MVTTNALAERLGVTPGSASVFAIVMALMVIYTFVAHLGS